MIEVLECKKYKNMWKISTKPHKLYINGKGGQLGDIGLIENIPFLEVLNENEILVKEYISPGIYSYTLSKENQDDIAIQHTTQHLFSALAYKKGWNTVGFKMSNEYTTVDLDCILNENDIFELEKEVNIKIKKGASIKEFFITRKEEKNFILRKKISEKIPENEKIRMIEIENIDLGACSGFHVSDIKNIGLFKIVNFEKIKSNFTRIYFLSGNRALKDYNVKHEIIKQACSLLNSTKDEITIFIEKLFDSKKNIETSYNELIEKYTSILLKEMNNYIFEKNNKKYYILSEKKEIVLNFLKKFDNNFIFIGLWENGGVISSKIEDCTKILDLLKLTFDIKGGGKKEIVNFKGSISFDEITKSL